jgi:hypothetical protein
MCDRNQCRRRVLITNKTTGAHAERAIHCSGMFQIVHFAELTATVFYRGSHWMCAQLSDNSLDGSHHCGSLR